MPQCWTFQWVPFHWPWASAFITLPLCIYWGYPEPTLTGLNWETDHIHHLSKVTLVEGFQPTISDALNYIRGWVWGNFWAVEAEKSNLVQKDSENSWLIERWMLPHKALCHGWGLAVKSSWLFPMYFSLVLISLPARNWAVIYHQLFREICHSAV